MKKILSGIISAAAIAALSCTAVSAEVVESRFPMNGNKCGKVIVTSDIERDVEVVITQNTQDGNFDYYKKVIPMGNSEETYEFVIEGKDDVSYTVKIGAAKYKNSANLQYHTEEFTIYDTDEIPAGDVKGYEYRYAVHEGEELTSTAAVDNVKDPDDNVFKTVKDLYFPVAVGIKGDVNMNGKLEMKDIITVAKHFAKLITLEGDALELADFNNDQKVNLRDVIEMANQYMGGSK